MSMLIDEVLSVLGVLVEEKLLRVKRSGTESGAMEVKADRSLLRVALMNVIHNAIKFSPTKGLVKIHLSRSLDSEKHITLLVENQGSGLSRDEQDRVFDRFYRGDNQAAGSQTGTGLGLSIAKLVIQRAGGDIRFDSEYASGARCILTLPAVPDGADIHAWNTEGSCDGRVDSERQMGLLNTTMPR